MRDRSRITREGLSLVLALLVAVMVASRLTASSDDDARQVTGTGTAKPTTVLFMCPHGAAKSVLASAYFQRAAKERGLNVRVDAAGTHPDDAVSPAVADHLRTQGYAIPVARPRLVTRDDLRTADVVISLGCDVAELPVRSETLQRWDDVPGPGEDLKGADEAIRRRVEALVEELLARQRNRE